MLYVDEKAIKTAIRQETLQSPVLLYGSEEYLKQYYLNRLITRPGDAFSEFNDIRLDCTALDMAALTDAVMTLPFMAQRKTVLLYNVAPRELTADQFKQLEGLFSSVYEGCMVLFAEKSGAIDDKKCDKSKKLIKLFDKVGSVICIKERGEAELCKMLQVDAAKEGCSIGTQAQKVLLSRCGREISALKSEMAKLCAYRECGEITQADVCLLSTQQPADNIYGLSRAILRGEYDLAMRLLADLFYLRYPPESILGTLSGCYVDLFRARCALKTGKGAADIAMDFGYGKRSFALENAIRDQKRLSDGYFVYALEVLSVADLRLKSTQCDAYMVFQQVVTALFLKNGTGEMAVD